MASMVVSSASLRSPLAARLPEADRASALQAGDDAPGAELAEELGVACNREVQRAGSGLGGLRAGEERVLASNDADDE
jgi:hypothetical protein